MAEVIWPQSLIDPMLEIPEPEVAVNVYVRKNVMSCWNGLENVIRAVSESGRLQQITKRPPARNFQDSCRISYAGAGRK